MHLHQLLGLVLLLPGVTLGWEGQRCYYDSGKLAPADIIPCYTSFITEHYSCCKVGNKCLRDNACYDAETSITYQYGCTDKTYRDERCAEKCYLDRERSHWVGLVYCNGTRGLPKDTWVCHHPDNCGSQQHCLAAPWGPELESLSGTYCEDLEHDGQYIAFYGPSTISDLVPLPPATELSSYFSQHATRTVKTSATASASASQTSLSSARFTAPVGNESGASRSSAETTATEVPLLPTSEDKSRTFALAIGLGAGIPAILAAAGFLAYQFCTRQRRRGQAEAGQDKRSETGSADGMEVCSADRAELPGNDQPMHEAPDQPMHEAPASPDPSEMQGSTVGESTPFQSPYVSPLPTQTEFSHKAGARVSEIQSNSVYELPG